MILWYGLAASLLIASQENRNLLRRNLKSRGRRRLRSLLRIPLMVQMGQINLILLIIPNILQKCQISLKTLQTPQTLQMHPILRQAHKKRNLKHPLRKKQPRLKNRMLLFLKRTSQRQLKLQLKMSHRMLPLITASNRHMVLILNSPLIKLKRNRRHTPRPLKMRVNLS